MIGRKNNVLSGIVQSRIPPSKLNVLWDDLTSNTLKVYRKTGWTTLGGSGGGSNPGGTEIDTTDIWKAINTNKSDINTNKSNINNNTLGINSINNKYISLGTQSVKLGGSFTLNKLKTDLGLGSLAYLNTIPSEYITETELDTELDSYYTNTETDAKLDAKLNKSVWDGVFRIDENGDLRCITNFIGEKEVSAYGEGEPLTGTGGSGIIVVDDLNSSLTDAALSANQGRVLKELIDTKTVDVDLTDYAKQTWVSQNFISVIPSEYITSTELEQVLTDKGYATTDDLESVNPDLTGYATESWVEGKGYLTAIPDTYALKTDIPTKTSDLTNDSNYLTVIPSEYITETELDTELDSYYTKNETDTKLDAKLNKSVWDGVFRIDTDGNLRCTTNFIGEKEVSAYGEGDTASSTVVVVDDLNSSLTDAALSANQGRVLKELIDAKTVNVDLSDYAKQDWVSQNFISIIPSEYITETELNTSLNSYYTKAQIDAKGYITAIPSEYIDSTELNTALNSYYTKTETDTKLNAKVDKTTWDSLFLIDSNGDLHVKTNLIGEKEVSAYNVGTEDNEEIVEGGSEWYNIHTKRLTSKTTTATDMYVVIENLDDEIVNNPDNYRIVLLTWKRKKGEGNRWRVPMFSPRWLADTGAVVNTKTPCAIAWNNTWWPITGTKTKWWNTTNAKYTDVFDTTVGGTTVSFKNNNKRMRFGCCIMKKMEGVGTYGWQRVSNISEIMLFAITGSKHFCSVK